MKNNFFSKRSLLSCFLAGLFMPLQALNCTQDSLYSTTHNPDRTHNLNLKEALVPTAVIGLSAIYASSKSLTTQKEKVQDALSAKGKNKIKLDDYIQYSPMIAVYGLNLLKIKGEHLFKDRTIILAMSYATMGIIVNAMKYSFKEKRPDSNARNSFPSGHTATAFMGAEFLYKEYKRISPYIGYAGYAVAIAAGYLRIYNNRHYINDVVAGACIGIASTKLAYWIYPKLFKQSKCNDRITVIGTPYYHDKEIGMNLSILF